MTLVSCFFLALNEISKHPSLQKLKQKIQMDHENADLSMFLGPNRSHFVPFSLHQFHDYPTCIKAVIAMSIHTHSWRT